MKKQLLIALAAIMLVASPFTAYAAFTTNAGGTGLTNVATGAIPFGSVYNIRMATSSAFQWNNGLLSLASTTIGNGTQTGGLTVSGGATTTGNAYVGGKVGIGTTSPSGTLAVYSTTNGTTLPQLFVDSNANNTVFRLNNSQTNGHGWNFYSAGGSAGSYASSFSIRDAVGSDAFTIDTSDNSYIGNVISPAGSGSTISGASMTVLSAGNVGIGSTSPYAQLSIATPNGATGSLGTLFAIASSTQAGATTTLFSVSNVGNVGVGTTTPAATLDIAGTLGSQRTLFNVSSTTATNIVNSLFSIKGTGHVIGSSTSPTLSGCGTSPSVLGDDRHGTVTAGGTATGCTVTFATPYTVAPSCVVTPQTGSIANSFSYTESATAITVTQTGLGSGKFDYNCEGFTGN